MTHKPPLAARFRHPTISPSFTRRGGCSGLGIPRCGQIAATCVGATGEIDERPDRCTAWHPTLRRDGRRVYDWGWTVGFASTEAACETLAIRDKRSRRSRAPLRRAPGTPPSIRLATDWSRFSSCVGAEASRRSRRWPTRVAVTKLRRPISRHSRRPSSTPKPAVHS